MATYCESRVIDVDDETLLLDQNETTNYVKSKQERFFWSDCDSAVGDVSSPVFLQEKIVQPHKEHCDSPEDSPLLNEDCSSADDTFHCHLKTGLVTDDAQAWQKLILTSSLCFVFMVTELIGGYLAGSLAVMTDAAHLFSDFVGLAISLASIWISKWPATPRMTFGYYRAEVLGAFLSVLTVWFLAGTFCILAVQRLWKGDFSIHADTMLYTALAGVLINIIMGSVLHGVFHSHTHTQDEENMNVRAAAAHVLGDLLQSCGVLLAAIIIKFFPNFKAADPICTVFFAVIAVLATARVGKDSAGILLEATPGNIEEISLGLRHLAGVKHLHSLHMWSLSPGKEALVAHLAVGDYCDRDDILRLATKFVKSKKRVVSCTIQIEPYHAEITNNCKQCQFVHF